MEVNRLGGPYGDCVDVKTKGKKDNVYEETLPIDFSTSGIGWICHLPSDKHESEFKIS